MTLIAVLALFPVFAHADGFTYDLNLAFIGGGVTRTITTDTNSGVLSTADLIDWNITLNDGSHIESLLGPFSGNNSVRQITGSGVTATAMALSFDFGTQDRDALFFGVVGPGENIYLCLNSSTGFCDGGISNASAGVDLASEPMDGITKFAQIVNSTSVPEPSTLVLLGTGALGLAGLVRRRLVG